AVTNVAPSGVPQAPGTIRPAENGAISKPSVPAPPAQTPTVPQTPGAASPTPIDTAPNPSAVAKPMVPGLAPIAPVPVGPTPGPPSPAHAGQTLGEGATGLGIPISLTDGYSYDPKGRRDP